MTRRSSRWLQAVLLALPLVAFGAWIARGAILRSHGVAEDASASPEGTATPAPAGMPAPELDLGADRLEERVDGGADGLRAAGCRGLRYWRSESPAADAESLLFGTEAEARAELEREAGSERTAGPGDEAQLSAQTAYFRRGSVFVRVFADPGVDSPADLARLAERLDRAILAAHE